MTGLALAPGGVALSLGLAALAVVLFSIAAWLGRWQLWVGGYLLAVLTLALAFFFRDPARDGPRTATLYLAPADGRVEAIERVTAEEYLNRPAVRIAIDLGLFDVRVQRSPVDGVVDYLAYPSSRSDSDSTGAPTRPETAVIGISTGEVRILVRRRAGRLAGRIVTYVREGELVEQAERIGRTRFGSLVEIYLPGDAVVTVRVGDRVVAGETAIARAPDRAAMR